jgi:DNA-binding GntR family transcriptional regulator
MHRSKEIYREIRDRIISGQLNPGERLIEIDLAEEFGFSRGPIREAFRYLEKDGYIETTPNKGAIVTKVNIEDVKEYYALLAVVECKAIEWAYPNLEEHDFQELSNINKALGRILHDAGGGSPAAIIKWSNMNVAFHSYFASKSGNSKLPQLQQSLRKRLFRLRYFSSNINDLGGYLKGHEDIISHLRDGDYVSAQNVMERHIMGTCEIHASALSRDHGLVFARKDMSLLSGFSQKKANI